MVTNASARASSANPKMMRFRTDDHGNQPPRRAIAWRWPRTPAGAGAVAGSLIARQRSLRSQWDRRFPAEYRNDDASGGSKACNRPRNDQPGRKLVSVIGAGRRCRRGLPLLSDEVALLLDKGGEVGS